MSIPGSVTPLFNSGGVAAAGGYQIERSLRFSSNDSAYCSRVAVTPTDATKFTLSFWVKRSKLGADQVIMYAGISASDKLDRICFLSNDTIELRQRRTNVDYTTTTSAVFRDCSAWYHIVYSWSSGTRTLYVNGVSQAFAGNSTTTATHYWQTSGITQYLGRDNNEGGSPYAYGDFYLADIYFIDGQALTPSSFTEVSATTGQLIPKAYTGSFGTNGFWLKFSDNSAATATTLGKDYSGNSNNWTPNNLSVTAGAGNDSLVDTPTSYGTDTGAGGEVRGNYCTLNPLNINASLGTSALSNGNLDVSGTTANGTSTIAPNSGKWYAEFVYTAIGSSTALIGVSNKLSNDAFYGATQSWQLGYTQLGKLENAGSQSNVTTYTTNDVIGVAFDCSIGQVTFYKNGSSIGSITNSAFANVPVAIGLGYGGATGTNTATANFGQRPFAYTAPSGFKALCDTNLTAPVVAKPSTVMDVVLYSGTGSNQTITGLNFNPDFVWLKRRSSAQAHYLYDVIRGTSSVLYSDGTDAEQSISTGLTAFNSNGFSLGSLSGVNASSTTNVAWTWDAGTSTVTNTQGSISSGAQVRANPSSGFSVVTWVGDGTGTTRTVGHGLGVAPSLIIAKNRTSADGWPVYHKELGNSQIVYLNTTAAASTNTAVWNSTSPTSTVFSIGGTGLVNELNYNYVAYCFAPVAGYSSFGSYTGNGSADGPFVYTGFRPKFVLARCSAVVADWWIYDSVRGTYNVNNAGMRPNLSNQETTDAQFDFLSNGFKLRTVGTDLNSNGSTHIYAAFAENPFQYARAR